MQNTLFRFIIWKEDSIRKISVSKTRKRSSSEDKIRKSSYRVNWLPIDILRPIIARL
jgi:hypothetical protein